MALTIASSLLQEWTAVAQNTVVESTALDITDSYMTFLEIQAALDTTTAHTGTRFKVEFSHKASGDEDWADSNIDFVALIGTAATDLIEDNPLAATSTAIALTGHALTVLNKWLFIENGTLANSEVVKEISQTANEIVILDGTTNAHAQNTAIFNLVISKSDLLIPMGAASRLRVAVDNSYDPDGSTLNYRVRYTKTTGL